MQTTLTEKPVAGIHVLEREGTGPTVLALAGLGSSAWAWAELARTAPDIHLVATSLRGRGASAELGGPTGLRAHAKDVAAVIRELDLHDVVIVGHSYGAYLAPLVVQECPDRIARVVLVDGGIPPKLPFFFKPAIVRLSFKTKMKKLTQEWPSAEAFVKAGVPKILKTRPDLLPVLVEMFDHEMAGEPGHLRVTTDGERCATDAVDCFFNPDTTAALEQLTIPAQLFTATSGEHDGAKVFLAESRVQEWLQRKPNLTAQRLTGNHATVVYADEVRAAILG